MCRGGAAGRGVSGGGGSGTACVLLRIMGAAAMQRLGAAPQEGISVSASTS